MATIIYNFKCEVDAMNKNDVVMRIGQARNKAGLSARELSQRIGKNEAYISRLESAKDSFEPSISALLEIISACGISEEEFFYYNQHEYEQDKRIIELLKKAKPEIKESIIKVLENI